MSLSQGSGFMGPAPPPPPVMWHNPPSGASIERRYESYHAQETLPELVQVFVNGAYYPNWAVYGQGPPSDLNVGCLSHVFYAFAKVEPDGTVAVGDQYADTQLPVDGTFGGLNAFGKLKADNKHLKLLLSVGGAGSGSNNFAAVARNEGARKVFAHTAKKLVTEYGLDGIDIDWEHPSNAVEGADFVSLLKDLRSTLPSPEYLLTTALPAGEWALRHIDMHTASQYLDFINLMAYDFSGPWNPHSGHQSQLFCPAGHQHGNHQSQSGHKAITYLRSQNVNPKKIILGIPAYGRSFQGTSNIGQPYAGSGEFLYKELPRPGAGPEIVDLSIGAVYTVGGGSGFVTYDNPETVKMKASYVRDNDLGGVFFWNAMGDVRNGPRSLISTSYVTLHNMA